MCINELALKIVEIRKRRELLAWLDARNVEIADKRDSRRIEDERQNEERV
jgi:hypothetical protein